MKKLWIIGVDYKSPNGPISEVCVARPHEARRRLEAWKEQREAVLGTLLKGEVTLHTATWNPTLQRWVEGALVEPTPDHKFITTEKNDKTRDNLGSLPSFIKAFGFCTT